MENLLDSLSGIERVKYLKTLIEKVNNISANYVSIIQNQPQIEESQGCSACTSKSKRFLLEGSQNSNKIVLKRTKPVSQKCDVRRLKFLKHENNYGKNCAPYVSKCEAKTHHQQQHQNEIKTFKAIARDASVEVEKRYLRQIYSTKATNETDDNEKKQKPTTKQGEVDREYVQNETEIDRRTCCRIHFAKEESQKNVAPIQENPGSNIRPDIVQPRRSKPEFSSRIVTGRNESLIGDGSVTSRNRSIALTNGQQPILERPTTINSDGTRRIAGQPCAHCQRAISDVAFFNGNRQLCVDCADSHFRRVTTARFTNRPMSYREFKVVGGDNLHSN